MNTIFSRLPDFDKSKPCYACDRDIGPFGYQFYWLRNGKRAYAFGCVHCWHDVGQDLTENHGFDGNIPKPATNQELATYGDMESKDLPLDAPVDRNLLGERKKDLKKNEEDLMKWLGMNSRYAWLTDVEYFSCSHHHTDGVNSTPIDGTLPAEFADIKQLFLDRLAEGPATLKDLIFGIELHKDAWYPVCCFGLHLLDQLIQEGKIVPDKVFRLRTEK